MLKKYVLPVMFLFTSGYAIAEVELRGFASIVGGSSLDDEKELYFYDEDLNFKEDSLFAIQAEADVGDGLTATIQLMSRGREDFDVGVEWAHFTYQLGANSQLSAGRMRIPFYRYSDFIDVRYANVWVRPPRSLYDLEFPGYDGLSFVNNRAIGDWESTVQLIAGELNAQTTDNRHRNPASRTNDLNGTRNEIPTLMENLVGVSWTMNNDWFTGRFGYFSTKASLGLRELDPVKAAVDPAFDDNDPQQLDIQTSIFDAINAQEDATDFYSVGIGIDYNSYILESEFVSYVVGNSLVAEVESYYVTAGKRMGDWTLTMTYSQRESSVNSDFTNYLQRLGTALGPAGATLVPTLAAIANTTADDTELLNLTLRYDFHESAALKIGFDSESYERQGSDELDGQLLRVGVDMLF